MFAPLAKYETACLDIDVFVQTPSGDFERVDS